MVYRETARAADYGPMNPTWTRIYRRHPLYAFAFSGTLALAVAAATVSLAVIQRAFLEPLPYPNGDRLVSIQTIAEGRSSSVSPYVLEELGATNGPLSDFVSIRPEGITFTDAGTTDQLNGIRVTEAFFSALGAAPLHGRALRHDDRDVVVISSAFWVRAMAGDLKAVGRSIAVNGTAHTVVGIMPPSFRTPYFKDTEVWLPLDLQGLIASNPRARRGLTVLARRVPEATGAQVDAYSPGGCNGTTRRSMAGHRGQAVADDGLGGGPAADLNGRHRLGPQEMAEDEMAHLAAAAAVPADVNDERVRPREKPERIDHRILIVPAQEPGDFEVSDVAVEDLGLPHPEIQVPGVGRQPSRGGLARVREVAEAQVKVPVQGPEIPGHQFRKLRRALGVGVLAGPELRSEPLTDQPGRIDLDIGALETGDRRVDDGGANRGGEPGNGRGRLGRRDPRGGYGEEQGD